MCAFALFDASHAEDRERWIAVWRQWPAREVFAHPAYLELFARPGDVALAAVWDHSDATILFPFIRRPIEGTDYCDLTSPYGYGGAFSSGDGHLHAAGFWAEFAAWTKQAGVVSEFVRLSVGGVSLLPYPGEVVMRQDNVVVPTLLTPEAQWESYDRKVRKNVAKARRSGVTIITDSTGERLADFLAIYQGTMTRRQARATYFFPREFFQTLVETLPDQFIYFHALLEGRVISTELALVSSERIYSFLGGTDADSFEVRPNDLLKHEMIGWARERGVREFVLGGGYDRDDGIFRYKRDFFPEGVVPFFTGQRIHDPAAYLKLVDARTSTAPISPGFFPAYRAPYLS